MNGKAISQGMKLSREEEKEYDSLVRLMTYSNGVCKQEAIDAHPDKFMRLSELNEKKNNFSYDFNEN